jgi:hypothetical protein
MFSSSSEASFFLAPLPSLLRFYCNLFPRNLKTYFNN